MKTIIEEYGMFIISCIVFAALMVTLNMFKTDFKTASQAFIQNITGVSAQYSPN